MLRNRGKTSLKVRRRAGPPMNDFDRLPKDLRSWIAQADLPWRPKSVQQAFHRFVAQTGDRDLAFEELDRLQRRLVCKDAKRIWGDIHPEANAQPDR